MKILGLLLVFAGLGLLVSPATAQRLAGGLTAEQLLRISGGLVALAGVLLIAGRGEIRETVAPPPGADSAPAHVQQRLLPDEELRRQVTVVLEREGKINAIKFLRERTSLDLKQAKEAVENLERGARK